MKKTKKIVSIIVILILAFIYAHINKANMIYDKGIDSSEYIGTGVFEDTVEQEFICHEETLDGISVKCQFQGEPVNTTMSLELVDVETGDIVAESKLLSEDIKNSKFNAFMFEKVKGCKGKEYRAVFKTENVSIEERQGIGLVYQKTTEENTKLTIAGQEEEGTLIIKTITKRFDLETFCVSLFFVIYIAGFIKFLYKLFS